MFPGSFAFKGAEPGFLHLALSLILLLYKA